MSRVLLAGRISSDPFPLGGGNGELLTLAVPDGAGSRLWAAFRGPDQVLDRPLADGDAVAIIGTVDQNRRASGPLQGLITIDAMLSLKSDGGFFGNL